MSSRSRPVRVDMGGLLAVAVLSLVGIGAFLWPFFTRAEPGGASLAHHSDAPWLLLIVMPLLVVIVLAELTAGHLDAKAVAVLGVLGAIGTAMRMPTGGIAGLELVFFLLLPAGRVFGRGFGFVLGATTIAASAVFTAGVGPWLPFQMLAAGWVGLGAACLPRATGRREIALLAAYGVVASFAFGVAMNLWFWPFGISGGAGAAGSAVSFVAGDPVLRNLKRFWAFHVATSLGWDLVRAVSTATMVFVLGRPVLGALRRASQLAAFDAPSSFVPPAE